MNSARTIRWLSAVAALVLGTALAWKFAPQNVSGPALPALAHYARLPAAFDAALQQARADAIAHHKAPDDVRRLARLYHANRLFPEAEACYRAIAARAPGLDARDHYALADIAANRGNLDGAVAELRAVLQSEPDYLPAQLALAEALFKSGQPAEAAKVYAAVLKKNSDQPQAALGLARIDLQRGDEDAAVARLEDLAASHPEAVSATAVLAKILERRGESDRAAALTQVSLQKPEAVPADPWSDALLADCYDAQRLSITFEELFKQGRMDLAAPLLDRLSVLDPTGPITKMFSGFSHAKALEHVTAIREYYAALAGGGDPEKICPSLVQSLLALGKGSEALGLLADYFAKMPESAPIAIAYADLAMKQGDHRLARSVLEAILKKQPNLVPQNMSLARILWADGNRAGAAVCLQRVARLDPADIPSRALLGEYYLGKGDPRAAMAPLQEALAQKAIPPAVHDSLRQLLATAFLQEANGALQEGRLTEAVDDGAQAANLVPDSVAAYACQADALVQLQRFAPAAAALEKMVSLQPDNPTFYLSLGDVRYQNGQPDVARRQWEKARQLVAAGDRELIAALDLRLAGRITAETFR